MIFTPDMFSTNLLFKRIAAGDDSAIDEMTERDFDMEQRCGSDVFNPLTLACNNGHLNVVERLLK